MPISRNVEDVFPDASPPPPLPEPLARHVPCCAGCGYLLVKLPEDRCPECGREFDPSEISTYAFTNWYRPVVFWTPAIAGIALLALMLMPLATAGLPGLALWLLLPLAIGLIMHYGWGELGWMTIYVTMVLSTLIGSATWGFCLSMGIMWITLLPLCIGAMLGDWLRHQMRDSEFSQAQWLPED